MRDALAEPSTLFVRFVLRIHPIVGDSDGDSDGIALIGSLYLRSHGISWGRLINGLYTRLISRAHLLSL